MSTPSAPDDDLLLAALEAAEQGAPLSAEAQARLKADPAFAAEFNALKDVSALMRQDAAWGADSGTDAPPPHLMNAILQAEVAARPDAIRQAIIAKDSPLGPARAWWQRLSSFVVGGGVVVGAAAAILITVQRAPEAAPAAVALQAPQTELPTNGLKDGSAKKLDAATGQATGGLAETTTDNAPKTAADKAAVAAPSDDAEAAAAKAEASLGGDIADAALLAKGNRADIASGSAGGGGRGVAEEKARTKSARRERDGDDFTFGSGNADELGAAFDDDLTPPPPPAAEEAEPVATPSPQPTTAPTASAPMAPAPEPAPSQDALALEDRAAPKRPARVISADESRRAFLERQRQVADLKAEAKKKVLESSKEKAKSSSGVASKSASGSSGGYGPGDVSPDAIREQMARERQLQEANTLLLTAERELGFARFAGALDFASRAEAIAGGGLGLAPASTQVRAYAGMGRFADAARLASRLLNGSPADLQLVDGMLAGATAAENIGDFRLAERLLQRAAGTDNPDVARRQTAQKRLEALRGNANMAPAKRAAEKSAKEPAAAAVDHK